MKTVVLASHNLGKLREFQALLAPFSLDVRPIGDYGVDAPAETGLSFLENALLKARHAADHTGLPAIADDSGLVVDALGGAPGIRSARYAGEAASDTENLEKLLRDVIDVADEQRTARFVSVIVLLRTTSDPLPLVGQGLWEGTLLRTPRGDGGFGYDPIFAVAGDGRSAAELGAAEKNRMSHRAQAFHTVREALRRG